MTDQIQNDQIFDVVAIGNALVDIIAEADDAFLVEQDIAKNAMNLVSAGRSGDLYDKIGPAVETSGGSAANTMTGIASLGGKAAFMGKVKEDQLGTIFRHDMHAQGVYFSTHPVPDNQHGPYAGISTGRCIILVTPDAARSMNTYLGISVEFEPQDINADILQRSQITYLEGYLFDRPAAKRAFYQATDIVKQAKKTMALTLSDLFCVERHRAEFHDLVQNHIDILFANEAEILALYQTNDFNSAIAEVRKHTGIAVVTRGEKGAVITNSDAVHEVPAAPVDKVIDTTGAGDLYAAGFLYGITHGKSLPEAGRIGAIAAAEVISHYGPRPLVKLSDLI
ncbi:MAG: adenosine kinase [Alphaproteobacteria bacterium]|nr:adenosine kinase [Alphaproteobacteria bacterium]MBV8549358.1 adenosine kinase [Alphaproteobacteria bacterium]